jgi:hypothetical protein
MSRLESLARFARIKPVSSAVLGVTLAGVWGITASSIDEPVHARFLYLMTSLVASASVYTSVLQNEVRYWETMLNIKKKGYPIVVKNKSDLPYARYIANERGELNEFKEALDTHLMWNAQR